MASNIAPEWLYPFISESYFVSCGKHNGSAAKYFCIDCISGSLCSTCVQNDHNGHTILQVRKSSKCEAVRTTELGKLLNLKHIQPYSINKASIVYLNRRSEKASKSIFACDTCHRYLMDNYKFCSLGCKFEAAKENPEFKLHGTCNGDYAGPSTSPDKVKVRCKKNTEKPALLSPPKRKRADVAAPITPPRLIGSPLFCKVVCKRRSNVEFVEYVWNVQPPLVELNAAQTAIPSL